MLWTLIDFNSNLKIHNEKTGVPVKTGKAYGKSLKASELPAGIARFFPVTSTPNASYPFTLSSATMETCLKGIRCSVQHILDALQTLEVRLVNTSILIVYEADSERAKQLANQELDALLLDAHDESSASSESPLPHDSPPETQEDESEEDWDDLSSDDSEDEQPPVLYKVKLIDFAHAKNAAGLGPDQGVVKGLQTVLRLLDQRIADIAALTAHQGGHGEIQT